MMSGADRDGVEFGDAQKVRADLTGLLTSFDQRLHQMAMQIETRGLRQSELAKQIEMQHSNHNELITGMRKTTINDWIRWLRRCRI